ncbi:uncharacterized protein LOC142231379 [Haematobia irritans]|uniref:uncharacterized protein LOC142231379 n=1 Tax=Haematobia irritans TaxID=7368 RepID=UPI003F502A3E
MVRKYFYILFVLNSMVFIKCSERPFNIEVHNVTCAKYTERIKIIECEFVKFPENRYGINIRMMFSRNLDRSFQVRIWIDITPIKSKQIIHLVDLKMSGCSAFKRLSSNKFLQHILKEFFRTSNLPKSCPVKANILFRSDNFTVSNDFLPPVVPSVSYVLQVELYEKGTMFGMWRVAGAIIAKK